MRTPIPPLSTSAAAALLAFAAPASAQTADIREALVAGSSYTREGCLAPCECPYIIPPPSGPLTGGFNFRFDHSNPLYVYYAVTDVDVIAHLPNQGDARYTGTGMYQIGGEVAVTQRLVLDLVRFAQPDATPEHFDSGVVGVNPDRPFPALDVTASTGNVGCFNRTVVVIADAVAPCPVDLGRAGGAQGPDGALDNNDFIAFIDAFFAHAPAADLGRAGGLVGADGTFDNNDFVAFVTLFFQGC